MAIKRALVTGATGFIGQRVLRALTARGIETIALARSQIADLPSGARLWRADLLDQASVRGAADGCDTVIHLAGLAHRMGHGPTPTDDAYDRVNVGGTRTIIAEARRAGVQRVLFMSSSSAAARESPQPLSESLEPRPTDAYGRSKLRAEHVVREAGTGGDLWTVALRPPMVYGPGNRGNLPRLMRLVRAGIPLPLGAVRNTRSILFIENLVHAMLLVLERQPGSADVFYVADAPPLSTPHLITLIGRTVGRRPILIPVPVGMLRAVGRIGDSLSRFVTLPFTSQEVMRLAGSLVVDDRKLRAACGYEPPMTSEQGLMAMARAMFGGADGGFDSSTC